MAGLGTYALHHQYAGEIYYTKLINLIYFQSIQSVPNASVYATLALFFSRKQFVLHPINKGHATPYSRAWNGQQMDNGVAARRLSKTTIDQTD